MWCVVRYCRRCMNLEVVVVPFRLQEEGTVYNGSLFFKEVVLVSGKLSGMEIVRMNEYMSSINQELKIQLF